MVPTAGEPTTEVVCVEAFWVMLNVAVSSPVPVVADSSVLAVSIVGISAVIVVSTPTEGVLVSSAGRVLPTSVGVPDWLAPQAAVTRTKSSEPNKNSRENFFIFQSPSTCFAYATRTRVQIISFRKYQSQNYKTINLGGKPA